MRWSEASARPSQCAARPSSGILGFRVSANSSQAGRRSDQRICLVTSTTTVDRLSVHPDCQGMRCLPECESGSPRRGTDPASQTEASVRHGWHLPAPEARIWAGKFTQDGAQRHARCVTATRLRLQMGGTGRQAGLGSQRTLQQPIVFRLGHVHALDHSQFVLTGIGQLDACRGDRSSRSSEVGLETPDPAFGSCQVPLRPEHGRVGDRHPNFKSMDVLCTCSLAALSWDVAASIPLPIRPLVNNGRFTAVPNVSASRCIRLRKPGLHPAEMAVRRCRARIAPVLSGCTM